MKKKEPDSEGKNIYQFMHINELEALLSRLDPEKDPARHAEIEALIENGGYTYPGGRQKERVAERSASSAYEPDGLLPKTSDRYIETRILRIFAASLGIVLVAVYIEYGQGLLPKKAIALQPKEYKFLDFPDDKFTPLQAGTRVLATRSQDGEYRAWKLPVIDNKVIVSPLAWGNTVSEISHECRDFGLRNAPSGLTDESYISCEDTEVHGVFEWNMDGSSRNPILPRLLQLDGEVKDGIFYKN